MSASLHVPLAIRAKTEAELTQKILQVQTQENAKVEIHTILQDVKTGDFIAFYYPYRNLGGGVM